MRITDYEKSYTNIFWSASDINGNIVFAQSMESDIPEFVCRDKEKAESLARLFFGENEAADSVKAADLMNSKGFYCYIADDPYESVYRIKSSPETPAKLCCLSDGIKQLMADNILPFNAQNCNSFEVKGPFIYNVSEITD